MALESPPSAAPGPALLSRTSRCWILVVLFVAALGVRLYRIDQPPMDFAVSRQYHSALLARAFYFRLASDVPTWRRETARASDLARAEPPVGELVAATAYAALGREELAIPRSISAILWLIGGAFLYATAKRTATADSALLATAVYLFLPFGIVASRSFQPDPMMVMLLLASLLAVLRHHERGRPRTLRIAAGASALAMLVRPVSAFAIFGAVFALSLAGRSPMRRDLARFALLGALPAACYYAVGMAFGLPSMQAGGRLLPGLLLEADYWQGWIRLAEGVTTTRLLAAALLGVAVARAGTPRRLLLGLWTGYLVYGSVFTYHIHTHPYYHLMLVPICALSVSSLCARLLQAIGPGSRWLARGSIVVGVLAVACGGALSSVAGIGSSRFEDEVRLAREIGEAVDHSTATVLLAPAYGAPLQYHGELRGVPWPNQSDLHKIRLVGQRPLDAEARFRSQYQPASPEYFIVTDFRALGQQPDLEALLRRRFRTLVEDDRHWIVDLRGGPAPR